MSFPYKKFESFVSSIQNRKSFLIPDVNVILDEDELKELINICKNNDTAEKRRDIIAKGSTPNQKLLLLHAYWLWTYPFGFDGERKFNELFANSNYDIIEEHTTYKECLSKVSEPLVGRQGRRVSMRVARGIASLLPSHGRGMLPRDVLKKVSRGLSRVEAGNPGFPRLVQVTSGGFSWWL